VLYREAMPRQADVRSYGSVFNDVAEDYDRHRPRGEDQTRGVGRSHLIHHFHARDARTNGRWRRLPLVQQAARRLSRVIPIRQLRSPGPEDGAPNCLFDTLVDGCVHEPEAELLNDAKDVV
jgi:hypothetical protein